MAEDRSQYTGHRTSCLDDTEMPSVDDRWIGNEKNEQIEGSRLAGNGANVMHLNEIAVEDAKRSSDHTH